MGEEIVVHETKVNNAFLKTVLAVVEDWYRTHTEKDYGLNHLVCENPDRIVIKSELNQLTLTAYKQSKKQSE